MIILSKVAKIALKIVFKLKRLSYKIRPGLWAVVQPCGWGNESYCTHALLFRANLTHVRKLRPDSGLGSQVKFLETFQGFPLCSAAAGIDRTKGVDKAARGGSLRILFEIRFNLKTIFKAILATLEIII